MTTSTERPSRVNAYSVAPLRAAMTDLDRATGQAATAAGLEPELLELVKMRASQLNGCAYCLDLHSRDARKLGESEQRLYLLNAWRETSLYSDRERAALALAEAVTLLHREGVPEEVYRQAAAVFDDAELAALVWVATVINAWNRLSVTSHSPVRARP